MARFERQNRKVGEVMTHDPRHVAPDATLVEAAREMRDGDVGAILITERGALKGIITDRDIVVRAVADGADVNSMRVGEVDTDAPITIEMDQTVEDAVQMMREKDVRRLVVTDSGRPVGIVSIGDLAVELDTDSALADISAASPNN
jgi:signal-transduction protein with cAMP-binding, CBS, and nucleotidyltransferase domain